MECKDARDRFSSFVDGELPPIDQMAFTEHVAACERCRADLRALETALTDLRNATVPRPAIPLADQVLKRLQDRPSLIRLRVPAWAAALLVALAGAFALSLRSDAPARPLADTMRDAGYVQVGGQWLPAAEAKLAHDGQLFRDGRWVSAEDQKDDAFRSEGFVRAPDGWERSGERDALLAGRVRTKDGWTSLDELRERVFQEAGLVRLGEGWIAATEKKNLDQGLVRTKDGWKTRDQIASDVAAGTAEPTEEVGGVTLSLDIARRIREGDVLTKDGIVSSKDLATALIEGQGFVSHQGRWMTREDRDDLLASALVRSDTNRGERNAVTAYLDGLVVGDPVKHGLISVYPLTARAEIRAGGLLLSSDIAARLEVAETEKGGRMSILRVRTLGEQPVLLQAGTVLRGGNQDRLPSRDTVVFPGGWTDIPVYCCEHGRWSKEREGFQVSPELALPSLRRLVYSGRSQTIIWDEVKKDLFAVQAKSAYGSLRDAYDDAGFRKRAEEYQKGLSQGLEEADDATGVAVAVGDKLLSVELYGSPEVFRQALPGLLSGLSMQALAQERGVVVSGNVKDSKRAVKRALEEVFTAEFATEASTARIDMKGLTTTNGYQGKSLAVDGKLAHLVLFAPHENGQSDADAPEDIGAEKVKKLLAEFERVMQLGAPADRLLAIQELAGLGLRGSGDVLAKYLGDASVEVRVKLAVAIGARGERGPAGALVEALEANRKEPRVFEAVALSLARMGDDRAIEPFTKLLYAPDESMVELALAALAPVVLRSRDAERVEDAIGKVIGFAESIFAYENPRAEDIAMKQRFLRLRDPILDALQTTTGQRFKSATEARIWWTRNKAAFLKERAR